jgi:hypothetical protein
LNKDKALQIKGAKIIAKYGNPESEKIRSELQLYAGSLLSDAESLLKKFFTGQEKSYNSGSQNYEEVSWYLPEPIIPFRPLMTLYFCSTGFQ